jgi:hypothetical protein
MSIKRCAGLLCILAVLIMAGSCDRNGSSPGANGYFQTQFQTECQFIVEAVVSDLAEQIYFAAKHRLPEKKYFSVLAVEQAGSPVDAPKYDLSISLDKAHRGLKLPLNVDGPIWSPAVYAEVASSIAQAAGLSASGAGDEAGPELLTDLMDGTAESIERNNESLSGELERRFSDAQVHEQAALLLGMFILRDHSGYFTDLRPPLSRITAHLALAHFLSGKDSFGLNGRLAEALLLTKAGDETLALEELKMVESNDPAVTGLVRALRALNTGDWRELSKVQNRTEVESLAWFFASAEYINTPGAWEKLSDAQKKTIDYVRLAGEEDYSVEMAHTLLDEMLPLEQNEVERVYEMWHGKKLIDKNMADALNEMPEHCFTPGPGGKAHVRIIGWGQWALFLQRHMGHAARTGFRILNNVWGVPDQARQFADSCDKSLAGLRLYPFMQRFTCTDVKGYHESVDNGFKVTVATPQLVPAMCWNYLCYKTSFAPLYDPNPNPHLNEWHSHNPPPGTAYNLNPRLDHPSLIGRGDAVAKFERLHEMAPCRMDISDWILQHKYNGNPTYDQTMGLLQDAMPWSVYAQRKVATMVFNDPVRYEKIMLQTAALSPSAYFDLGDYAIEHQDPDKAAKYFDEAAEKDPDAIHIANYAQWRVRYCLKKGEKEKAEKIADYAGEVYSYNGLVAKAVYLEATSNYDGAFEWFAKVEERYNASLPLILFWERYKALDGDTRFDDLLRQRWFPNGAEKVSPGSFGKTPPSDGVLIQVDSDLLAAAAMKKGDVIVAINGSRVHTLAQYCCIRDLLPGLEMNLIVWQGDTFRQIKASLPNHRFGVDCGDYRP